MAFISSCAGSYSGTASANYIAGLRAWHILHGQAWPLGEDQVKATLVGAARLAPKSSKQPKREPLTLSKLEQIVEQLDKNNPLDAAVAGCVTTIFHSVSRTAEFTQKTLMSFDPSSHVKPLDVKKQTDRNGLEVTSFSLPKTKCSDEPEDAYWSRQSGAADPEKNFDNHIIVNNPPPNGPLFAYKHGNGHKALTHKVFLD